MPLEIIKAPLSVRARNALHKAGYTTVEECANLGVVKLLKIKNLGVKTAEEILSFIKLYQQAREGLQANDDGQTHNEISKEKHEYLTLILCFPVKDIFFAAVRALNVMEKLGLKLLKDLVVLSRKQISEQENSGKKTINRIETMLNALDLGFDMRLTPQLEKDIAQTIIEYQKNTEGLHVEFKSKYPAKAAVIESVKIDFLSSEKAAFYKKCFEIYKEGGTLEYAGNKIGLTRERVRQILVKGTKYGLFNYKGHEYQYFSKDVVLNELRKKPAIINVAKNLGISTTYAKRLLISHGIRKESLDQLWDEYRKNKVIEKYKGIVERLGHHPTTTELQSNKEWRYFSIRIARVWGSTDRFREELSIPKPPQGNPRFRDDTKEWREQRMRLAFIKRMQKLDDIREALDATRVSTSAQEISSKTGIRYGELGRFLNILINTGEICREGKGNQVKYHLVKGACV